MALSLSGQKRSLSISLWSNPHAKKKKKRWQFPVLDEKDPLNVKDWCTNKQLDQSCSGLSAGWHPGITHLTSADAQLHMCSPSVHWWLRKIDLINYQFKCDPSCLTSWLISCLHLLCVCPHVSHWTFVKQDHFGSARAIHVVLIPTYAHFCLTLYHCTTSSPIKTQHPKPQGNIHLQQMALRQM